MRARSGVTPFAAVCVLAAGGLQCTLDFDRYASSGDGGAAEPDTSIMTPVPDASGAADVGALDTASEGEQSEAAVDGSVDAPCAVPSQACLTQATSCAMTCSQQYQHCVSGCHNMGCMNMCTSQEQSCGGQCITKCLTCTQQGGCPPASSACLTAGSP